MYQGSLRLASWPLFLGRSLPTLFVRAMRPGHHPAARFLCRRTPIELTEERASWKDEAIFILYHLARVHMWSWKKKLSAWTQLPRSPSPAWKDRLGHLVNDILPLSSTIRANTPSLSGDDGVRDRVSAVACCRGSLWDSTQALAARSPEKGAGHASCIVSMRSAMYHKPWSKSCIDPCRSLAGGRRWCLN